MSAAPERASGDAADHDVDEKRMPFLAHLDELRSCLRNAAIAVVVGTAIAYIFRFLLLGLLARPLFAAWETAQKTGDVGTAELVFTSPVEGFMVLFKLSLLVGIFLASPVVFRELWRFISPGLYPRERRWGLAFVIVSVLLFVGGGLFAYIFVLPKSYEYFLGYAGDTMSKIQSVFGDRIHIRLALPFRIRPMITMDEYFGLTSMLLLVFGAVFELPMVLAVLSILGIVSGAQLWRFNRYAIVLFAVLGAVLTPGDLVVGQLAMTASLTVLYNLSILIAFIVGKKRKEQDAAEETALEAR